MEAVTSPWVTEDRRPLSTTVSSNSRDAPESISWMMGDTSRPGHWSPPQTWIKKLLVRINVRNMWPRLSKLLHDGHTQTLPTSLGFSVNWPLRSCPKHRCASPEIILHSVVTQRLMTFFLILGTSYSILRITYSMCSSGLRQQCHLWRSRGRGHRLINYRQVSSNGLTARSTRSGLSVSCFFSGSCLLIEAEYFSHNRHSCWIWPFTARKLEKLTSDWTQLSHAWQDRKLSWFFLKTYTSWKLSALFYISGIALFLNWILCWKN